jgi:chromosomal replication initiator protein
MNLSRAGLPWSAEEEAFLAECVKAGIHAKRLVPLLERPAQAIACKRCRMGLYITTRGGLAPSPSPAFAVSDIKRAVSNHFKIPVEKMDLRDRSREVSRPRQVAMFITREVTQKSYPLIGHLFGKRDHTTVLHAVRQVERLMGESQSFEREVRELMDGTSSSYPVEKRHFLTFAEESVGA